MFKFRRSVIGLLVACLGVAPIAIAKARTDGPSKAIERAEGKFDRLIFATEMAHLHERLVTEQANRAFAAPLRVQVSPSDLDGIREQAREQKMRVGAVALVRVPVSFSDMRGNIAMERVRDFGAIRGTENDFVWSGPVISPGAAALRVHLTEFNMPEGSELYIYTPQGMAFGPYTGLGPNGTGEFWTNTIAGSEVILQVHHQDGSSERPGFVVSGVGHITGAFQLASTLSPKPQAAEPNCSFNANCVVGAACVANDSAVSTAADAVAHMLFASGRYLYICSGGLVADSDSSSDIPYFVTANHCISKSGEANSLETFFGYTSTCGSCADAGSPSTNGASIIATNRTSDYTLLRLNQTPPGGVAYLGWDTNPIANDNGAPLYRLSHPQGAPQSYSEHVVDTSKGTCRSWPRGDWIYSRDILGATEGGSSGSPVVNSAGQLVGQLSGGCGTNVNDNCDSDNNATVDGAFAAYYGDVAAYLGAGDGGGGPDPENCSDGTDNDGDGLVDCEDGDCFGDPACDTGGGCIDNDGDGYCAEEDCDDNDSHVYPGHNDSKGRWGRDGIDNDCNGVIDG